MSEGLKCGDSVFVGPWSVVRNDADGYWVLDGGDGKDLGVPTLVAQRHCLASVDGDPVHGYRVVDVCSVGFESGKHALVLNDDQVALVLRALGMTAMPESVARRIREQMPDGWHE